MPLLHIPPEPEASEPRVWPKVAIPPAKVVEWTGPDGVTHRLATEPYVSITGRRGFGVITPEHVTERTMSGTVLMRDVRVTPRVMSVPLLIQDDTPEAYLAAYRALQASVVHKDRGTITPGTIRVILPDGSSRSIPAYYQGGLDPVEDHIDDMVWSRQEMPDLEFYAPDPAFQGPDISQSWRIVVDGRAFYPFYPLRLNPSQLGGSATVTNPGDLPAYPIWEITGPGTPTITNTDTGQEFAFTEELTAGQVVTVDTRPPDIAPETGLTAFDDSDTDFWPHFDGLPDLFDLPSGQTNLSIALDAATSDSRVALTFAPRYQAGW